MLCLLRPDLFQRLELFSFQLIIIDEKFFQVIGDLLCCLARRGQLLFSMCWHLPLLLSRVISKYGREGA